MSDFIWNMLRRVWQAGAVANDRLFRHGCDFSRWATQEELGFAKSAGNQYQPSDGGLKKLLKKFHITPEDAIIDIGCGKGKAMYLMSRFPFGRIAGYDLSEQLAETANENFQKLGLTVCRAFQGDAAVFDGYDEYNYIYLFNAVPEDFFIRSIGHILDSVRRRPRVCVFIYLNPVYDRYLQEETPFRLIGEQNHPIPWFRYRWYQVGPLNR